MLVYLQSSLHSSINSRRELHHHYSLYPAQEKDLSVGLYNDDDNNDCKRLSLYKRFSAKCQFTLIVMSCHVVIISMMMMLIDRSIMGS